MFQYLKFRVCYLEILPTVQRNVDHLLIHKFDSHSTGLSYNHCSLSKKYWATDLTRNIHSQMEYHNCLRILPAIVRLLVHRPCKLILWWLIQIWNQALLEGGGLPTSSVEGLPFLQAISNICCHQRSTGM